MDYAPLPRRENLLTTGTNLKAQPLAGRRIRDDARKQHAPSRLVLDQEDEGPVERERPVARQGPRHHDGSRRRSSDGPFLVDRHHSAVQHGAHVQVARVGHLEEA